MQAAVAVDLVVLTIREGVLSVLLVRRALAPFRGRLALPGGFVREDEDLDAAARRELFDETGIDASHTGHLEQLATFGAPRRDPRGRVISVAYLAFAPSLPVPRGGSDAAHASFHPVESVEQARLAFDHEHILRVGLERARSKLEYTTLATAFCGETFTLAELRRVYEAVWGTALDPANFARKVTKSEGFVVGTGDYARSEPGRPPQLYARGDAILLHPAFLRETR